MQVCNVTVIYLITAILFYYAHQAISCISMLNIAFYMVICVSLKL